MTREDVTKLKGKDLIEYFGGRHKHSQKKDEDLTYSDYAKCISDGTINGKCLYKRIPIRCKRPENILMDRPIEDADDLEWRIRMIVDWYRDMMPDYNIAIDFGLQALTDEEMDALIAEEQNESNSFTTYEVERKNDTCKI